MEDNFSLRTEQLYWADTGVIQPRGPLDYACQQYFTDAVADAIGRGWTTVIVVDMSAVLYLDGDGGLITAMAAMPKGGEVVLAEVSAPILEVLNMVGLAELFQIFPTMDDARDYASGQGSRADGSRGHDRDGQARTQAAQSTRSEHAAENRLSVMLDQLRWPGAGLIKLHGVLDVGTDEILVGAVKQAIKRGWTLALALDCSELESIAPENGGLLASKGLMPEGGEIVLSQPSAPVLQALTQCGAVRQFEIFPTTDGAVRYANNLGRDRHELGRPAAMTPKNRPKDQRARKVATEAASMTDTLIVESESGAEGSSEIADSLLQRAEASKNERFAILELGRVRELSKEQVNRLARLHKKHEERGGALMLFNVNVYLRLRLSDLALTSQAYVFSTLDEALAFRHQWKQTRVRPDSAINIDAAWYNKGVVGISAQIEPAGCCYFRLRGKIDTEQAPLFYGMLMREIEGGQCRFAIVDCGQVESIAGDGEDALGLVWNHLETQGGTLIWTNLSPWCQDMFKRRGLGKRASVFPTVEAAQDFVARWIKKGSKP